MFGSSPAVPYGITVFCDDLRQEMNGKDIYIGVYGQLILFDKYPITVGRLNVCSFIICKKENFERPVRYKIYYPGDKDGLPSVDKTTSIGPGFITSLQPLNDQDELWQSQTEVRINVTLHGIMIPKRGRFKVIAEIDGYEFQVGQLEARLYSEFGIDRSQPK